MESSNPKDRLGIKKVSMGQVPPVAIAHEACAMLDGTLKYGFRNYRDKAVSARVYVDACKRHLDAWFEGEEYASDSGVHHLGHARACLGILLDAQANGTLLDDRVKGPFPDVLKSLNKWTEERLKKDLSNEKDYSKPSSDPYQSLRLDDSMCDERSGPDGYSSGGAAPGPEVTKARFPAFSESELVRGKVRRLPDFQWGQFQSLATNSSPSYFSNGDDTTRNESEDGPCCGGSY